MSHSTILVEPGHRGTVSGIAAARFHQRATVSLRNTAGRVFALTTLVGQGDNVPLAQEANLPSHTFSFGPFNEPVSLDVVVENSNQGDNFSPSKVIKPITVSKKADATNPVDYLVSTILSEDDVDDDYTDCVLTVLQYK